MGGVGEETSRDRKRGSAVVPPEDEINEIKSVLHGQLFNFWKWRALRRRRAFLFPVICAVLNAAWGAAHYLVSTSLFGKEEVASGQVVTSFYKALPNAMYVLHGLGFLIYWTSYGQKLIHESQGKRLIYVNCLSNAACMIYVLMGRGASGYTPSVLTDAELGLLFGVLALSSIIVPHHCGLSQLVAWINFVLSTVLCVIFFSIWNQSKWTSVTAILILFVFAVCIACGDYEFCRTYLLEKAKDRDDAMAQHHANISRDLAFGLNMLNMTNTMMFNSMRSIGLMRLEETQDGGYRWSAHTSYYEQCRLLGLTLSAAVNSHKKAVVSSHQGTFDGVHKNNNEIGIYFGRECVKVFAMVEAARGQALPLYTDDDTPEIFFTAPTSMMETLLFLLLSDAVGLEQPGVCSIRLEKNAEDRWVVQMQIAVLEERANLAGGSSGSGSGTGSRGSSLFLSNSTPFGAAAQFSKNYSFGLLPEEKDSDLATESTFADGIGKYLAYDYLKKDFHTPLTRLANKIANFHANIKVDVETPEVSQGIVFLRRSFPLPGSAPFAISGHAASNVKAWILIEQHTSDFEALVDLKSKLELLRVPSEICKGGVEYKYKSTIHNVVVISEAMLHRYHEQLKTDLNRLSVIRVVLCESAITVDEIRSKFGLTRVYRLSRFATARDLTMCIQQIAASQPPRSFYAEDTSKLPLGVEDGAERSHSPASPEMLAQESKADLDEFSGIFQDDLLIPRSYWLKLLDRMRTELISRDASVEFPQAAFDMCREAVVLLRDRGSFARRFDEEKSPRDENLSPPAFEGATLLSASERRIKRTVEVFSPCILEMNLTLQQAGQAVDCSRLVEIINKFSALAHEEKSFVLSASFKILLDIIEIITTAAKSSGSSGPDDSIRDILSQMVLVLEKLLWLP